MARWFFLLHQQFFPKDVAALRRRGSEGRWPSCGADVVARLGAGPGHGCCHPAGTDAPAGPCPHSGFPRPAVVPATLLQSPPCPAQAPLALSTPRSKPRGSTQAEDHAHPNSEHYLSVPRKGRELLAIGRADPPGVAWRTSAGQGRAGKHTVPTAGWRMTRNHRR